MKLRDMFPRRFKSNHSETGTAVWNRQRVFYKRYLAEGHFDTELEALWLLRNHAPHDFRFVDLLSACRDSRTILFPVFWQDAYEAACESARPEGIVSLVCRQIDAEMAATARLPIQTIPMRALTSWHFLRTVRRSFETGYQRTIDRIIRINIPEITFRYDPQLANFVTAQCGPTITIHSIDFSMWRYMNIAYPYSFVWHDLTCRLQCPIATPAVREVVVASIASCMQRYGVNRVSPEQLLLASRAEALAHELDGHTRRQHTQCILEKRTAIVECLRELSACL